MPGFPDRLGEKLAFYQYIFTVGDTCVFRKKGMVIAMEHIQRFQLGNMKVNVVQTDKFKTNFLSFNFVTPLRADTASLDALLPMVLKRGCERYPDADALGAALSGLYGARLSARVRKRGEAHVFGMSIEALADQYTLGGEAVLDGACELLSQLLCRPKLQGDGFDGEYVRTEKQNLSDIIRAAINDKRTYAVERCVELMCADEPYGVGEYGKEEDLQKVTPQSLYAHYQKVLEQAAVEVFFVGSCRPAELVELLKERFASLPDRESVMPESTGGRAGSQPKEITEQVQASQGKLTLGFRTQIRAGEALLYPLQLFNAIYGGSPVSKLFLNVREKLSLCYYCSSRIEKYKGLMLISSGIENQNRGRAQSQILKELQAMRDGSFTDDELDAARKVLENAYQSYQDSAYYLEDWYLGQLLCGSGDSPEDALEKLRQVTREQITEAAQLVELDTVYFLEGTADAVGSADAQ